MQAVVLRRAIGLSGAALLSVVVLATPAQCNFEPGRGNQARRHGHILDAAASASAYAVSYEPAAPPPGHAIAAVSGWTPPACWLAPVATPGQLRAEREAVWAQGSPGYGWVAGQRDYYVNGRPHMDFERANAGRGLWWDGQANPNRLGDPAALSCFEERDDWVPTGHAPPAGPAVTPEILAESAYDRIRIPDTVVTLSPDIRHLQTVNVHTWAWVDRADLPTVSVTARLRSLGIWATATATPAGLRLAAGTPDADLHPRTGDCPVEDDGSIGEEYRPADGNTVLPPCGLTYRRSSGRGTYPLTATLTWHVTWHGSGATGGTLPSGAFALRRQVTVQQLQSVNR